MSAANRMIPAYPAGPLGHEPIEGRVRLPST